MDAASTDFHEYSEGELGLYFPFGTYTWGKRIPVGREHLVASSQAHDGHAAWNFKSILKIMGFHYRHIALNMYFCRSVDIAIYLCSQASK